MLAETQRPAEQEPINEDENLNGDSPQTESQHFNFNSLQEVLLALGENPDWKNISSSTGGDILKKETDGRQWLFRENGGKETSVTNAIKDEELRERHENILSDLYTKGFSVNEFQKKDEDILIREVYFADEKGNISYEVFERPFKQVEETALEDYDLLDSIDDDDYNKNQSLETRPATIFNLNSVFNSPEKQPALVKAEAGTWESFWQDLLEPKTAQQEVQDQPKDLFEIFGFKANLAEQNIPDAEVNPRNKEVNPITLFIPASPALRNQEQSTSAVLRTEKIEPATTILEQQPASGAISSTETIKLVENVETAYLPEYGQFEPIRLLRTETAPLYIDKDPESQIDEPAIEADLAHQELQTIIHINSVVKTEQAEHSAKPDKDQIIIASPKLATKAQAKTASIGVGLISPIPSYHSKEISKYHPLKQTRKSTGDSLNLEQDQPIKLIVFNNLSLKPDKTEASSVLASKKDESRPEGKNAEVEIQDEAPKDILVEIIQKPEDIKILPVKATELSKNPDLTENQLSIVDRSPATAIPKFSFQKPSNRENIRDPEPNFAKGQSTTEIMMMPTAKDNQAELKTAVNQASVLREQVKALSQLMKAPKTSTKVVELRQPPREIKINSRVRTQSPAQTERLAQTSVLEKTSPAAILTALENLKGQGTISHLRAENPSLVKEVIPSSNYRTSQPLISLTRKSKTPTAAYSAERLNRQRIIQTSQSASSYNDELITDNLSGIRLAA